MDPTPRPIPAARHRSRGRRAARGSGAGVVAALLVLAAAAGDGAAQDLLPHLRDTDPANGAAWLEPLGEGVASGLAAGFFTSGGRGTPFTLGVRWTASPFSGGDEAYEPRLPDRVVFGDQAYPDPYELVGGGSSPTVAGTGQGALLAPRGAFRAALVTSDEDPDTHRIRLPPGLGLSRAEVPVVEAGIAFRGLGVMLVGRFFPTVALSSEVGHVRAFGGGAMLMVSRFVGVDFVDVGVSAVTQKMDAADYLDASGSAFGVVVSRSFGTLRPYLTGTLSSARVDIRWPMRNPANLPALPPDGAEQAVRYSLDGKGRAAAGLVVSTPTVSLSAEFSPGSPRLLSVGLALGGG